MCRGKRANVMPLPIMFIELGCFLLVAQAMLLLLLELGCFLSLEMWERERTVLPVAQAVPFMLIELGCFLSLER